MAHAAEPKQSWYLVLTDSRAETPVDTRSQVLATFPSYEPARVAWEEARSRWAALWPSVMPVIVPATDERRARAKASAVAQVERSDLEMMIKDTTGSTDSTGY